MLLRKKIKSLLLNKLYIKPSLTPQIKGIKINKKRYNFLKNKYDDFADSFKKKIQPVEVTYPEKRIKISDSYFTNQSEIGDWLGNIIIFDGKYYRGVKKTAFKNFLKFYESGIYNALMDSGYIVPFCISKFYSDNYPIILELEQIVPKKAVQWTIEENKTALLFCSKLQLLLKNSGFMLTDPHIWNIVFFKDMPIYLDHGSINIFDNTKTDYSLVISLVYRLVFLSFSNSFFVNRFNNPEFNEWCKRGNESQKFEILAARNAFLKFHKRHSSKIVYKAAKKILLDQIVYPWDVELLFFKS